MALINGVASIIVVFFILSTFRGEAHIATSPGDSQTDSSTPSPATSECPTDHIGSHLIAVSEKTKEFLKEDIIKRVEDNTLSQSDRECLFGCFNAYQAALGSIETAIDDIDVKRYSKASEHVSAYSKSIEGSSKCNSEVITRNPDFVGMQKWAQSSAEDIINKLKSCSE